MHKIILILNFKSEILNLRFLLASVALCLCGLTHLLLLPGYTFAEAPPTIIKSDTLEYSAGVYTATGNVLITQENRELTASEVTLNSNTGDVAAHGAVRFIDGDNILSSESLMINLRTNYVRIEEGSIFIKDDNFHIKGDTIEGIPEDKFRIERASFTTCDGDPPCWKFRGRDINIHLNHIVTARGVSFSVRDIPVLYLPYIALPILQDRQTGFLIPRVGYNTGEGLKIKNAFFWALSKSQDATVYADYYGEKGWGSGLEYRYIFSDDTAGQFNGYYINDIQVDRSRWDIKYNHRQLLSEDLSAKLRINYLNDETLYKDISEDIGERLQRTQDSDLYVNRRWDAMSAHLWAQYTQNLTGSKEGIFQRLPEAGFRVTERRMGRLPVYLNLISSASRWEETSTGLTRLHLSPGLSARLFETTGVVFIPEAGAGQTLHYVDGEEEPVRSNFYSLGASLAAKFYRPFSTDSGLIEHFIEPVVRYEFAEGSLKGTPLFPDPDPPFPPFIKGGKMEDSLIDKNFLSFSLVNRIVSMNSDDAFEPVYLRLTQLYRIKPIDARGGDMAGAGDSGFSDLRLEAIVRMGRFISIDTDTTYSYKDKAVKSAGTDLGFRGTHSYLTLGQRYSDDPGIRFLTASAGVRLYRLDTSAGLWYDSSDHVMREASSSIRYDSQCWGVTFSYRYKPDEEEFNMLFTLKGIGSVGGI